MSNNQNNAHANPAKPPHFKTWTSVYHVFISIADAVFESPEGINHETAHALINQCIDTLYIPHEGEPAWDAAYKRWIEPSDDDEEVSR